LSAKLPVLGRDAPRDAGATSAGAAQPRVRIEHPALGIAEAQPSARDAVITAAEELLAELTGLRAGPVHVWLSVDAFGGRGLEPRLREAGAAFVQEHAPSELASAVRAHSGSASAVLLVLGASLCTALELSLTVTVGRGSAHSMAARDLLLPRDAGPVLRRVAAGLAARLRPHHRA
jgi:hypothetical protein